VTNKKTARLAREMKWGKLQTIGFMISFWVWAIENCEDGQLKDTTDTEIGFAVGAENLDGIVNALISSGFVDKEPFRIHDWPEHQYEFLRGKHRKTPDKLERILNLYRSSTGIVPEFSRIERKKERKIDIKGEVPTDPPTLSQVRELSVAEHLKADPERYFHVRTGLGWKSIIDWKSDYRAWNCHEFDHKPEPYRASTAQVPRHNPADDHQKAMDLIDRKNTWEESHAPKGKCSFCGNVVKGLTPCGCAKRLSAYNKEFGLQETTI
jgi:hypothetical protein